MKDINAKPFFSVVGETANGHQWVRETKRLAPIGVLQPLTIRMLKGVASTRQFAKHVPLSKMLALAANHADRFLPSVLPLQAVRETAGGNGPSSSLVSRRLLKQRQEDYLNGSPTRIDASALTARQKEILRLIAEGFANKQMAGVLSLSVKTVEKHRQALMNKLNIHTIAMLSRYAVTSGVVEPNRVPGGSATPSSHFTGGPIVLCLLTDSECPPRHEQRALCRRRRSRLAPPAALANHTPTKGISMKIKDIITRDPVCISPEASLAEAARKMRILDVGLLLVNEQDRLVGAVTDRDITVRAVAEGLDPQTVKVRRVMTRGVVCCFEDRNLEDAAHLMEEQQVRRLPVLDQEKHLVGIVSISDLAARAHDPALASEVLESVSSHAHSAH